MKPDVQPPQTRPAPIQLLATLGPASLSRRVIERLDEAGVTLFRINLSHTEIDALPGIVSFVREHTDVPICFDSEGAQIRTGRLANFANGEIHLESGAAVTLLSSAGAGREPREAEEGAAISLVPDGIARELEAGDLVSLDFNGSLLQVLDASIAGARARVLRGGLVGSNKAVSLQREIELPALSDKDLRAVEIGRELGIRHFALSFAARAQDVDRLRELAGPGAFVISKIETRRALRNLDGIAHASDALLIDRGDLSREVEIAQIPRIQRAIIARGRELRTPVYVATNLLESMLEAPTPTRAEVNDVYTTLRDGADGLVLAAETAIGRNPVQCANMVMKIAAGDPQAKPGLVPFPSERTSRLIAPHGGSRVVSAKRASDVATTREVELPAEVFDLAEQLAVGTLSPLRGFMDAKLAASVRAHQRLRDATPWPMEIALPASLGTHAPTDHPGDVIALVSSERTGRLGLRIAEPDDAELLAGEVLVLSEQVPRSHSFELTPDTSRAALEARGWTRVAGAVVSRINAVALRRWVSAQFEIASVDGILLALCGARDEGEALVQQDAILEALPEWADRIVIAGLPRLAAPSLEARRRLDAIRLKNLGCSLIGYDFDASPAPAVRGRENAPRSNLRTPGRPPMNATTAG